MCLWDVAGAAGSAYCVNVQMGMDSLIGRYWQSNAVGAWHACLKSSSRCSALDSTLYLPPRDR